MSDALRQAVKKLTADKKKLSMMIALVAVGMLLWGRLLLKQVPRTAVANPAAAIAEAAETDRLAEEARRQRRTVRVDLPSDLSRDLFALNPTRYARVEKPMVSAPVVEKSGPKIADENQAWKAASQAASGLVLQTTILGEQPRAVINGQVLRVGEKIKGFELRSVGPRHVTMVMNGIELHLEM